MAFLMMKHLSQNILAVGTWLWANIMPSYCWKAVGGFVDLLKYLNQSKMIQASRNGMVVGIKIPLPEFLGQTVPYGMSWPSFLLKGK